MRTFFLILSLLLVAAGAYGYVRNPEACKKLGADLQADFGAIYVAPPVNPSSFAALLSLNGPPSASSSGGAASGQPSTASASAEPPAAEPSNGPWAPPAVLPSQPNWTWTTAHGTYNNVQIVKVEADCVTILHSAGGALVPIRDLPADLQKRLNYNPSVAAVAAAQRQLDDAASSHVMAQERSAGAGSGGGGGVSDYALAVALAKSSGRKVLVHFTGSDWCPYCQKLDDEVISTSAFAQFVAANYIYVTLDFPHNIPQSEEVKRANAAVAAKFGVDGYPTLLVIDGSEKVLGKMSGYEPGSGPGAVIAQLKSF